MIAVVLDANVIVSGFPGTRGAPSELIERWLVKEFRLITSEHILNGVERAWSDPWFRERYSPHEAQQALALATAIAGRASVLVTGDRRLRAIANFQGIVICSPREFVSALEQGGW